MSNTMQTMTAAGGTAPATTDWWGNILNGWGSMAGKIFESVGEGSSLYVQGKVQEKLGYDPRQQQTYLDATTSAQYQRQQQTGVGRDWDGATLNDDVITMGGLTVNKSTLTTGGLLLGGVLLAVLAIKVIK